MSAELVKSFEIIFGELTTTERKWLIDHIGGLKANADVVISEENDRLITVLTKLANEVAGWHVEALAEVGGWTNARCLMLRAEEARAALTAGKYEHASLPLTQAKGTG